MGMGVALPLRVSACGLACALLLVARASFAGDGICSEAASATLDGIPAYAYCGNTNVWTNNGVDTLASSGGSGWVQTEGGYGYQCVEFAVRYFYFHWNVSRGWFVGYAKDMCGTHPADVSVTTNPVAGDLAVITPGCGGADATAGHVGAVQSVATSSFVMVQQNPAGTYTWPKSCVSCFLHAAGNGGSSDPCSTAPSNGDYCGQSTQFGGGTPNDLYVCQNGVTASKTPCQCGCIVEPPGTNDKCASPCTPDAGGGSSDAGGDAASHEGGTKGGDSGSGEAPDASGGGGDSGSPIGNPQGGDASDVDGGMWGGSNGDTGSSGGCAIGGNGDASLFGAGILALSLVAHRRRRRRDAPVREHPRA